MFQFKKLILPVGLLVALFIAMFFPKHGIYCKQHFGVEITVIAIFFVNGYLHNFKEVCLNRKFFFLIVLAILANLIILPFIGCFLAKLMLPLAFATGIIVIVSMPPTLSSGVVITEIAGGNSVLAMLLTICLNLLGLITIPIMIKIFLGSLHDFNINSVDLFIKLLLLVLIPFIIGKFFKIIISQISGIDYIKLIPPVSVVLAVWMCLSISSKQILETSAMDIFKILCAVVFIHVVFLIFNYVLTLFLKISKENREAFIFVVSQKTMPLAVLILSTLSFDLSYAVIACILYHFMQILFDSALASAISKRKMHY